MSRVFSIANGKAKAHRVALGDRVGDEIEIVGGLPAESVIVTDAAKLADGVPVEAATN